MDRTAKGHKALVSSPGSASSQQLHPVAVSAHDEAEASGRIMAQHGEETRCTTGSEEPPRDPWPRDGGAEELREYNAIVWRKEPGRPGQRLTLEARSLDEARARVEAQLGADIVCSIWNEQDANQVRERRGAPDLHGTVARSLGPRVDLAAGTSASSGPRAHADIHASPPLPHRVGR